MRHSSAARRAEDGATERTRYRSVCVLLSLRRLSSPMESNRLFWTLRRLPEHACRPLGSWGTRSQQARRLRGAARQPAAIKSGGKGGGHSTTCSQAAWFCRISVAQRRWNSMWGVAATCAAMTSSLRRASHHKVMPHSMRQGGRVALAHVADIRPGQIRRHYGNPFHRNRLVDALQQRPFVQTKSQKQRLHVIALGHGRRDVGRSDVHIQVDGVEVCVGIAAADE